MYVGRLISLVNFHEMALQSIWRRDISKDPLSEPLQAKFQLERMHSSRLIVIWSKIGAQKVLFHQDNAPSHKSTIAMTKLRIRLWIDSLSTLFSGFGPVWLLSVPKLKNLARWEEILVKWGSRRQWVFYWLWDSLLQMTTKRELRLFWLKFGLKGFEEWIFRDVASSIEL